MSTRTFKLFGSLALVALTTAAKDASGAIAIVGGVSPSYNGLDDPWEPNPTLVDVGVAGPASLSISSGSVLRANTLTLAPLNGGTGSASVTGAGSKIDLRSFLFVGSWGQGQLRVEEGAAVNVDGQSTIGGLSGNGAATVRGVGSTWISDRRLEIGAFRDGRLLVEDGGYVRSGETLLATFSSSSANARVIGAGSRWSIAGPGEFGGDSKAEVEVSSGGVLEVDGNLTVGKSSPSGSRSFLRVLGTGAASIDGDLTVAETGSATVSVDGTSSLTVLGATYLGRSKRGDGKLALSPTSTFSTRGLVAGLTDISGASSIPTTGLVTDIDLVFDSPTSLRKTLAVGAGTPEEWRIELDATDPATAGPIGVGFDRQARLEVSGGTTLVSRGGELGYGEFGVGTGTVSGAGTVWENRGSLTLGRYGRGNLRVSDQARLSIQEDLVIGDEGIGELILDTGVSVETSGVTYTGRARTGTGVLQLKGATLKTSGLVAAASDLRGVGSIQTNGLVTDAQIVLSPTTYLQQTVSLEESPLRQISLLMTAPTDGLYPVLGAGVAAAGRLRIQDGLDVRSSVGLLGLRAGSSGEAAVTGASSRWDINSELSVGIDGRGSLSVGDGAVVSASRLTVSGNSSSVTISGLQSSVQVRGSTAITPTESGGLFFVEGGAKLQSLFLDIGSFRSAINATSPALARITGEGSTLEIDRSVNVYSNSSFEVNDGASVRVGSLGVSATGSRDAVVRVSGNATEFWVEEAIGLQTSFFGAGARLLIEEGGIVAADRLSVFGISQNASVRMGTGGTLALATGLSPQTLALIEYPRNGAWAPLAGATLGQDYWIEAPQEGPWAGFTLLRVGFVPEPACAALLASLLLPVTLRRR